MKIEISLPIYLDKVLSRLNAAGFESYLVGGAIRDTLLGIKPHDYDVTTNANKTEIAQIFSDMTVFQAGSAFSTMILVISPSISIEITSFRSKDPNTLGQSLEEDLGLRDFTIDSMAIDEEKNLYDFNKGLEDLKARKIRTVGSPKERFLEDPLRMLRYFRLMAKFNFSGDDNTLQAIKDNASLISKVSPERIRDTLKDILIIRPTLFKEMSEVGLLIYIIKDVDDLFSVSQNNPWHYTDVGNHTIDALRFFENYHDLSSEDRYILSNAILFHDLGKRDCKTTDAKGIDHFYQ
ncbi:MAG: CCA tRNA nucleotidyltransferase, partial [Bacilli bacterium]